MAELQRSAKQGHAPASLWWAMCGGPLAWALDLGFSYALAQHSCSTGHYYVMHLITGVCFVIALSAAFAASSQYKELPQEVSDEGRSPLDRAYFQVLFGFVFSIAFAVIIIAGAVPRWILSPCQ
jgi:formate/nitrite transporter FocA (FNT family)